MDTSLKNTGRIGALEPIGVQINRFGGGNPASEGATVLPDSGQQQPRSTGDKAAVDAARPVSKKEIDSAIKDIQSELDFMNKKIAFKVDAKYGETVVQVVRKDNGDVISQFPPEKLLEIRAAFKDISKGIFLNQKI